MVIIFRPSSISTDSTIFILESSHNNIKQSLLVLWTKCSRFLSDFGSPKLVRERFLDSLQITPSGFNFIEINFSFGIQIFFSAFFKMHNLSVTVVIEIILDEVQFHKSIVQLLCDIRFLDSESSAWRDVCCSFFIHCGVLATHTSCLETELFCQIFQFFLVLSVISDIGELSQN